MTARHPGPVWLQHARSLQMRFLPSRGASFARGRLAFLLLLSKALVTRSDALVTTSVLVLDQPFDSDFSEVKDEPSIKGPAENVTGRAGRAPLCWQDQYT